MWNVLPLTCDIEVRRATYACRDARNFFDQGVCKDCELDRRRSAFKTRMRFVLSPHSPIYTVCGTISGADACYGYGFFHCITTEGLSQFLIDHGFNQSGFAMFHLIGNSCVKRLTQLIHCAGLNALKPAGLSNASIRDLGVKLGADKIVFIPKRRVFSFLRPTGNCETQSS